MLIDLTKVHLQRFQFYNLPESLSKPVILYNEPDPPNGGTMSSNNSSRIVEPFGTVGTIGNGDLVAVLTPWILVLICVLGILGNLLIAFTLIRRKQLKYPSNR